MENNSFAAIAFFLSDEVFPEFVSKMPVSFNSVNSQAFPEMTSLHGIIRKAK